VFKIKDIDFKLSDIKQIKKLYNDRDVNKYLKDGWIFIGAYQYSNLEESNIEFIVGNIEISEDEIRQNVKVTEF
jgi:hypothetical protein